MSILVSPDEIIRALNACRKSGRGRFFGSALLLYIWARSHFWGKGAIKVKPYLHFVPLQEFIKKRRHGSGSKNQWVGTLKNLASADITWRAPWFVPKPFPYQCGQLLFMPLLDLWGTIGYALLLVR